MTRNSVRRLLETAIGAEADWSGPNSDAESDAIKEAIRLYVETWILPYLETANDKITRKGATR